MTTTKRAYKLQEFVAHASNVNCLKIGRKTSRILATGGEDHKVNLWSIGKPNAILSLSGHSSPVESVNFDPSEVLVAAGAASGTIKLWELEEAKIVRTLTGHRSNCTAVDFHPFGEFFASGSLDTNLKIWDIRRKGCIHTYKGHTRGVNALRFTPDGRWVVSGGEDNTVKIWDLTAGKLLHDFKHHDGQVQCIDFHPHEFLLATGSADKTVNFWDLETFELIGSAGPETTGIRSMTFNPDGRTLLCGLQESLRIFSWEPIRCHDVVDVGWSRLSDLNIHEGKLLGCSYNQSCVGVWVVDISVEPYGRSNGHSEPKSSFSGNLTMQAENNMKTSMGRISLLGNSDGGTQESKHSVSTGSLPGTPRRVGQHPSVKMSSTSTSAASNAGTLKRSSVKAQTMSNIQSSKFDNVPVIVPRTGPRIEPAANSSLFTPMHQTLNSGKESGYGRVMPSRSRSTEFRKQTSNSDDSENESTTSSQYGSRGFRRSDSNETTDQDFPSTNGMKQPLVSSEGNIVDLKNIRNKKMLPTPPTETPTNYQYEHCEIRVPKPRKSHHDEVQKGGRIKSIVSSWNKREQSSAPEEPTTSNSHREKKQSTSTENDSVDISNEAIVSLSKQQHEEFLSSARSRLTKLQIVHRLWQRNDVKGMIDSIKKMSDHAVSAEVISVFINRMDIVTLDICTIILPVLTFLLESKVDRSMGISLNMLLKIVRHFGPVIHSTMSASSPVGVDLEAEQRMERCNQCFIELERVRIRLPSLTRRGGDISKSAQELKLVLREVL